MKQVMDDSKSSAETATWLYIFWPFEINVTNLNNNRMIERNEHWH